MVSRQQYRFHGNLWRRKLLGMALCVLILSQFGFWGFGEKGGELVRQGESFAEIVPIVEYLGPLAPVALSPFFGIAMLSGAALLTQWGWIPGNAFLKNSETLSDPMVFLVFLGLAIFTSLPRFAKVTKPVAQAADQLESYAGIATILVLQALASLQAGGGAEDPVVIEAGFVAVTGTGLVMILSAMNLFVINTVKFVFEVLIWLCPIPTIDAIFEATLKTVCAGLMVVYLTYPWLSAVINGIMFLICLLVFRWAYRLMNYYRVVLFGPIVWGFLRGVGLARIPGVRTANLPGKLRMLYADPEVVLPVYPGSKTPGFPRRVKAWLVRTVDGKCLIARRNWRGKPMVQAVRRVEEVGQGFIANWVTVQTAEGSSLRLQFSRKFNPCMNALAERLQAPLGGEAAGAAESANWREISRQMGREARGRSDSEFRKDLA